ncbi:MAG: hypothetical protein M1835_001564, partial [Candelina submexicana]
MDVVASSFAVVSLSIQIADSVKKLSSFLGSAIDAPSYVRRLIEELDIFKDVLEMIARDIEEAPLPASNIEPVRRCLVTCNERVQNIVSMVNDLEQALSQGGRRMRWASLKTAFKKEKMAEFRAE